MPKVRMASNMDEDPGRGGGVTELLKRATEVILHFVRFCPIYLAECTVTRKKRHCL
jgi:hypothetical protein